MLAGDIHGNTNHAKWLVNRAQEEQVSLILQLGDFGLWPGNEGLKYRYQLNRYLESAGIGMLVTGGNHEDYNQVDLAYSPDFGLGELDPWQMESHIFWLPRGFRFTAGGVRFMSLGGAYSVDKQWRTEGRSWWAQEQISDYELDRAIAGGKCDVMLTHDKPKLSNPAWNRKDIFEAWPNQEKIQEAVEACRPKWLFHGHLHFRYTDLMQISGGHTVRVEGLGWDGSNRRELSYIVRSTDRFKGVIYDFAETAVVPGSDKYPQMEALM